MNSIKSASAVLIERHPVQHNAVLVHNEEAERFVDVVNDTIAVIVEKQWMERLSSGVFLVECNESCDDVGGEVGLVAVILAV